MREYYYVLYEHDRGSSWRVYSVWFWQDLIKILSDTVKELEEKGISQISLKEIRKIV